LLSAVARVRFAVHIASTALSTASASFGVSFPNAGAACDDILGRWFRLQSETAVSIRRTTEHPSQRKLVRVLLSLLDASTLCAIATVTRGGTAYINTAYFAWTRDLRVVWLSAPGASHSKNLRSRATAAIAVFDSNQVWGKRDRGVQMFGSAAQVRGADLRELERVYRRRFPDTGASDLIPYRFYALRPRRVKLFDERELGPGVFVTARVRKGEVTWERSEKYEGREREIELP
jgi:uncharacterized protein YhbP (UPF0306 family)